MIELVQTDLPEPVAPAIIKCGIFAMSPIIAFPAMSFPTANASWLFAFWNASDSRISRSFTTSFFRFGTSIPTTDFPGTGASIRMLWAERFKAISSDKPVILETFTPAFGCTSYLVTDGPRWTSFMETPTLKSFRVSSSILLLRSNSCWISGLLPVLLLRFNRERLGIW